MIENIKSQKSENHWKNILYTNSKCYEKSIFGVPRKWVFVRLTFFVQNFPKILDILLAHDESQWPVAALQAKCFFLE